MAGLNVLIERALRNHLLVVFFGTSVAAGLGFISNVFMARSISIENFGSLAFFYTCIVSVFSISEIGFGAHYVVKANESRNPHYQGSINELNSLYRLVMRKLSFPLGLVATASTSYVYDLSAIDAIGIFVGAFCLIQHKYLLSVNQAHADWTRFSIFQSAPMVFRLIVYFFIIFGASVVFQPFEMLDSTKYGLCVSLVISVLIVNLLTPGSYLARCHSGQKIRKYLLDGLPTQALINTAIVLFSRIDVFLLMYFVDSMGVAIYFAANSVAMIFPIITRSLMNYYMQKIAVSSNTQASSILRHQLKSVPVVIMMAVLLVFYGSDILAYFFGVQYSEGGNVLAVLSVGYLGGIIFTPFEAYFYSRDAPVVLKIKFMSIVTMVGLSLLLVETYGAVGIATALTIAKLTGWLMVTFFYSKVSSNEKTI